MATQRKTEEMVKYGAKVIADVELESIRAAGCLCLRCTRLVTVADCTDKVVGKGIPYEIYQRRVEKMVKSYNCPIAQRIYEACIDGDVAAPVTRCPMFVEKPTNE